MYNYSLLYQIVVEICVFVIPLGGVCKASVCSNFSVLCYVHGGLWVVMLMFDFFYRIQHNKNRKLGYLEFYRKTRYIRQVPLLVSSGGSVAQPSMTSLKLQFNLLILLCLNLVSLVYNSSYVLCVFASSQCVASDCPDSSL